MPTNLESKIQKWSPTLVGSILPCRRGVAARVAVGSGPGWFGSGPVMIAEKGADMILQDATAAAPISIPREPHAWEKEERTTPATYPRVSPDKDCRPLAAPILQYHDGTPIITD